MGDGFTVDPEKLRSYAQRVDSMIGAAGAGRDAADHIMTTNSYDVSGDPMRVAREYVLGKVGLHDNGRLDMAYGIICQPAGMLMEDLEQAVTDSIGNTLKMMGKLSAGLRQSATRYTEDDVRGRGLISDAGSGVDDGRIPVPDADTSVHRPHDDVGTLPHLSRIPQVRQDG
jgi:hypothetical protein